MPRRGRYQRAILAAATTAWIDLRALGGLRDRAPLERSARQLSRGGLLEHYAPRSLRYRIASS